MRKKIIIPAKGIKACMFSIFLITMATKVYADCPTPSSGTMTKCVGDALQITAYSSDITGMKWYTSSTGGTNIGGVMLTNPSPNVWISSYGTFTSNVTYYVSDVCGSSESARAQINFVAGASGSISIAPSGNPSAVCGGTGFTLTAGGGSGYQWRINSATGSVVSTATVYTPITTGNNTYYLTGAINSGCTAGTSQTVLLPVNITTPVAAPTLSVSGPATTTCEGIPLSLTATPTSPGAYPAYTWKVNGQVTTVISAISNFSFSAGISQVSCTMTSSEWCITGAPTATSSINITATGAPIVTGVTTFCGTGALTVQPGINGKNYWYTTASGGSPFDTDGTITEYLLSPGTYTYYISSYSSKAGCETSRTAVTAIVYDKAYPGTLSGIIAPVRGGIYIYTVSNPDNNSLLWTVPTGSAIVAGQGTNSIHMQTGTVSGTIGVVASDGHCGTGYGASLDIISSDINYVRDETVLVSSVFDPATISGLPVEARISKTVYIDGLGRGIQELVWQQSPLKKDIIRAIDYDAYGRTPVQYLPFATQAGNGNYVANWAEAQPAFYQATAKVAADNIPSAKTVFEPSPLDRVQEQGGPGSTWQPTDQTGNSPGHTVKTAYLGNAANEVRLWQYDYATGLCISPGSYAAAALYKTQTTDENGSQSWNYTDVKGRTVYKKVVDTETYYVYDDFGLPRITIPPMGTQTLQTAGNWTVTQTFLDTWCYQYQYDDRQRMSQKKIPGAQWAYMVYDDRDRLVLSQDGNQRATNAWLFTKHDIYNRPVAMGVFTYSGGALSQAAMQSVVDGVYSGGTPRSYSVARVAASDSYTNESFPTAADGTLNYLTYTYYDDYSFKSTWNGSGTTYNFVPELGNTTTFDRLTNKVTGVKVKVLNDNTWLKTISYYDDRSRAIQTISDNYTASGAGGLDRGTSQYDFAGRLLSTQLTHTGIENVSVNEYYYYDHAGRLLDLYHSVNGASQVHLAHYSYNELGQLVEKDLQSPVLPCTGVTATITSFNSNCNTYIETQQVAMLPGFSFVAMPGNTFQATTGPYGSANPPPLQSIDYRYNIRGWLTSINNSSLTSDNGTTNNDFNDLWGMELKYNTTTLGIGKPQFNGNIAEIAWNRRDYTNNLTIQNAWGTAYGYDPVNRLKTVQSARKTTAWALDTKYDESFSYDKNGNITVLTRNGVVGTTTPTIVPIDQLTYTTYKGNQVIKIEDAASGSNGFVNGANTTTEYTYDANGNMITDLNKSLGVTYNYINLPQVVTVSGNIINYVYDAGGRLLKKTSGTGIVYYCGGIEFEQDGTGAEQLYYTGTGEGRVVKKSGIWGTYEYFMTDHLGNTAISFDQGTNGSAEIIQGNTYYAFGLGLVDGTMAYQKGDKNRRLFNKGSELQDDFGLNVYFTRDRTLRLDIPIWWQIDPKADQGSLVNWTPYNVSYNNPIRYNDPNGDCPECIPSQAYEMDGIRDAANETEATQWGIEGAKMFAEAYATVMLIALPVEELAIAGAVKLFQFAKIGKAIEAVVSGAKVADIAKTADKVSDVAKVDIQARANQIQNAQPNQIARNKSTTAVAEVKTSNGQSQRLVSSSRTKLTKDQRAVLQPGEIEVTGKGHAESTIIDYSLKNQLNVQNIAASRNVCENCASIIITNQPNANIVTPFKKTIQTP